MATDNSGAKSSSTADSYVGSLISLTSKSEIRYEGILYNINTEESSIGLINVRSFGTEGRKKDGPQVPQSDKVYEYILFRGSDIKDLQVKSSAPVQPIPPINNDPAIIQSHYPRTVPNPSSLPSAASGSLTDIGSHNAQLGLPGSSFQAGLPLYQPGGTLGSWGASPPPPSANSGGLAMPMYWQGYYATPNGLPQLHQQSLLRPPPGLSVPPSMQQSMQYPNFNVPLPTGASNLPGSSLPEVPSQLLPNNASSPSLISSSILPSTSTSTFQSTLPPVPSNMLASETMSSSVPHKVPAAAPPMATPIAGLPSLAALTYSSSDAIIAPISNKPNANSGLALLYQSTSQPTSSVVGPSISIRSETPTPSLVTPGQLLQTGSAAIPSSQPTQTSHKDVEVVQVSSSSTTSEQSATVTTEAQPPILPLPVPSRAGQKPNGAPFQARRGYRGREWGRGTGSSHPVTKFTEDFDFMAMNEKFKKDEVWGHLGKSNKTNSKDKEGDGKASDEDGSQDGDDAELSKIDVKPLYNKEDFFDALSCNTIGHESQGGRTRFSEQMKIDTETFGEFSRYRGGRGGRGARGGRSRGVYYGRGNGYGGRGRGRAVFSYAS